MVKKWIIMIVLMIFLIAGCIAESIFVNKAFDDLISSLTMLELDLKENKEKVDTDELINKSYKIHNDWNKKDKILKSLIWHSGIKDVEIGIARISVYIEENDFTEAYAEISSLIDYLSHYSEDFSISWENIF